MSHTSLTHRLLRLFVNLSLVSSASLLATTAIAQSAPEPLPDELISAFNRRVEQGVNSVTLFTSQNSISSGAFNIEVKNSPNSDLDFEVFRFPLVHLFGVEGDTVRPILRGVFGTFSAHQSIAPFDGIGESDFSHFRTWSYGVGAGVQWKVDDALTFSPGFDVVYSKVRRRFDFNNNFSQEVLKPYDDLIFNTSLEVITYEPSIAVAYEDSIGRSRLKGTSQYTELFNDSTSSTSEIIDVSSHSGLWQNTLEALIPLDVSLYEMPLFVRPFLVRSDLYGAARNRLGFAYFHEIGTDLTILTNDQISFVKELHLGGSYTVGHHLRGVSVALNVTF